MPPPKYRKVAYSGKKKRQQLKERNAKKNEKKLEKDTRDPCSFEYLNKSALFIDHSIKSNSQSHSNFSHESKDETKKLVSIFEKLSQQEIEKEKLKSMQPLKRLPKESLEINETEFKEFIDFPKRPYWDHDMSKEEVEKREKESFEAWINYIQEKHGEKEELSWYERNIEVWRQLWRVLEISDVILVVMDIRNPLLHFPRSLYNFITHELKKSIVGVFNKVDLVSEFTVLAWKKYFEQEFPNLRIATFSCYPRDERLIDDTVTYTSKTQARSPRKRYYHAQGAQNILSVCRDILDKPGVNADWNALIARYNENFSHEEKESDSDSVDDSVDDSDGSCDTESMDNLDSTFVDILNIASQSIQPRKVYVTLGLVGHPNVGKSSLINNIMKRTVVGASETPGHTKRIQTIHIADNVRLCDSPGLVFPALVPRALQILSGMYPISQVQEPYSAIGYLAEHIPLEDVLSLTPFDIDSYDKKAYQWSTWSLCEAFAENRGFRTAQTAQPDIHRAVNTMLRLISEGRILLSFKPPGFFTSTKYEKLRMVKVDLQNKSDQESVSEQQQQKQQEKIVITGGGFSALASHSE
ncbi:unnamed protein product [Rhizopus stolonifer]